MAQMSSESTKITTIGTIDWTKLLSGDARVLYLLVWLPGLVEKLLTHWGRDKMTAISQTTFSNVFSWMKMYEFHLRFHCNLFLRTIYNIPVLVEIMAWRRRGDKPLSEPMMVRLPTHICVTRPQRVNSGVWSAQSWAYVYCIWRGKCADSRGLFFCL